MTEKRKSSLGKTLINLALLVPSLFSLLCNITTLIRMEARLAGKSLVMIIGLLMLLGTVLISTWFCVLALLFIYLTSLQLSTAVSLVIILLLNILTIIFITSMVFRHKKNLLFPETCRQIFKNKRLN